jgi:hypothetical protein
LGQERDFLKGARRVFGDRAPVSVLRPGMLRILKKAGLADYPQAAPKGMSRTLLKLQMVSLGKG